MFSKIQFWQLMVLTGFLLLAIGLLMIFFPTEIGNKGPFLIQFFEVKIEGSGIGLALIVLSLSCFLIGHKDLVDLRNYQSVQSDLQKSSSLSAKLVADRVQKALHELPGNTIQMAVGGELDIKQISQEMAEIQNGSGTEQEVSRTIDQAERGLALLNALEVDIL